jgi:hypothetical protein
LIAPSQNFHTLGLFKYQHSKELNFPTLLHGNPLDLTIFKKKSYQQIAQRELLHKSKNLSINKLFRKLQKIYIQKVIGFRWVHIQKGN